MRVVRLGVAWSVALAAWPVAGEEQLASVETEQGLPQVAIHTSMGTLTIELWPHKAPHTVRNFLELVDGGFYAGTVFHRVIAGFVIQAGGYDAAMQLREPPRKVVNESFNGERNLRWTVAMARHGDPDSADSQFFVNLADSPHLDARPGQPGYTVFGVLTAGRDVAEEIEFAETGQDAVPTTPITILSAERLEDAATPE